MGLRACIVLLCCLSAGGALALAQGDDNPIWVGVYTAQQAENGKAGYERDCASCHKDDLTGGFGPALRDAPFLANWEFDTVARLVSVIRDSMPLNYPLNVSDAEKIDIVAYLLARNGYPAGSTRLTLDADLDGLRITRKGSPAAPAQIADFSTVQTVGCLASGPDGRWQLARASAPLLTRPRESTPRELALAGQRAPGGDTFLLINASRFQPSPLVGNKVEVKGFIHRLAGLNRVSVTSLQFVSAMCGS